MTIFIITPDLYLEHRLRLGDEAVPGGAAGVHDGPLAGDIAPDAEATVWTARSRPAQDSLQACRPRQACATSRASG
jgi:hypothetical protein